MPRVAELIGMRLKCSQPPAASARSRPVCRWVSRDPIDEEGGANLYGMVENDAVNQWDLLGKIGSGNGAYLPGITPGPPTPNYVNTRPYAAAGVNVW